MAWIYSDLKTFYEPFIALENVIKLCRLLLEIIQHLSQMAFMKIQII